MTKHRQKKRSLRALCCIYLYFDGRPRLPPDRLVRSALSALLSAIAASVILGRPRPAPDGAFAGFGPPTRAGRPRFPFDEKDFR